MQLGALLPLAFLNFVPLFLSAKNPCTQMASEALDFISHRAYKNKNRLFSHEKLMNIITSLLTVFLTPRAGQPLPMALSRRAVSCLRSATRPREIESPASATSAALLTDATACSSALIPSLYVRGCDPRTRSSGSRRKASSGPPLGSSDIERSVSGSTRVTVRPAPHGHPSSRVSRWRSRGAWGSA